MNKTLGLAALIAGLLVAAATLAADAPQSPTPEQETPTPAARPQALRFDTPDAAAAALIEAAAAEGRDPLYAVLGPDLDKLTSGDPVADAADRRWFVENAQKAAHIEDQDSDSALLVVGPDDWPFPIPLAKDDKGWYFDTAAGAEELVDRRIGRNELFTLAAMRAFVDAEREYAAADPNGDGVHAYADRILSTEGQRDGLYWPTQEGGPESPLGPLIAEAVAAGYNAVRSADGPRPFHGYLYKVLTAQGDRAPGGAASYLKDGRLTEGVALLAWPATYGSSGIMTFQVNQRGIVYQKDLGDDTAKTAESIDAYNPGDGWEPATD